MTNHGIIPRPILWCWHHQECHGALILKPGAVPVICAPHCVPHAIQPKLKDELDRMLKLGVIRKLDINEASESVHILVILVNYMYV